MSWTYTNLSPSGNPIWQLDPDEYRDEIEELNKQVIAKRQQQALERRQREKRMKKYRSLPWARYSKQDDGSIWASAPQIQLICKIAKKHHKCYNDFITGFGYNPHYILTKGQVARILKEA